MLLNTETGNLKITEEQPLVMENNNNIPAIFYGFYLYKGATRDNLFARKVGVTMGCCKAQFEYTYETFPEKDELCPCGSGQYVVKYES